MKLALGGNYPHSLKEVSLRMKLRLFTLKRGSNANATLRRLLDRQGLAAGNVLNESGGEDSMYVDVDEYLNAVPLEENGNNSGFP
ncbi:hypothetical protein [Microseira sp. BLCC-F43]|uniref:hypothetical protein n=1 Tax=Microseira sp. BLCC-F43 TaxID=3153602 RepID=UPI0035B9671B